MVKRFSILVDVDEPGDNEALLVGILADAFDAMSTTAIVVAVEEIPPRRWHEKRSFRTVQCEYVNPDTGHRCGKNTSRPPYCWVHTEIGRPGPKVRGTRCTATTRRGRRCIRRTRHESGLCGVHRGAAG